ncbi:Melanoma-associated antigen B1 [Tupaia chinensis]|uniref:Melanoma-associated antigen B1 n=1 Tax=Tupaia chinensis TaxID=246437 RepID=L9JEH7_TUPCH|nr:Melanoma-associated antigen B1 [Tupaia chinensis]
MWVMDFREGEDVGFTFTTTGLIRHQGACVLYSLATVLPAALCTIIMDMHNQQHQTQSEDQDVSSAQVTTAEVESLFSSSTVSEGASQSSPAAGISQECQGAQSTSIPIATISCTSSNEDAKSQGEEGQSSSCALPSSESSGRDPLVRKEGLLLQFLLHKYKMKEPILKADMLKIVNRKYKEHFPEILRRTTKRMELVFGLDLKEVNPNGHSYTLVSKLDLPNDGSLSNSQGLPKNRLLMPLLGVIFVNGNRATEEEMWEFLNVLGLHDGKRHFIFGEPRKFITQDFVREKYLEYQQLPDSDPPRYEFLWGPRAYTETTKTEVLKS